MKQECYKIKHLFFKKNHSYIFYNIFYIYLHPPFKYKLIQFGIFYSLKQP